ncbi:MAG: AAA family ATPase, partial [Micrococcales bacterium]|nr:AAA family ATPase [Micrococcales bacterium]
PWTGRAARPPFVGREREFDLLEAVWADVAAGAPQTVLLGGAAGVGKSRLVAEAARAVHRTGASVLHGQCTAEDGRPFDPFVRPLSVLVEAAASGLLGSFVSSGGEPIAELRAVHQVAAPVLGTAAAGEDVPNPLALLDGVAGLLAAACVERPLLLVLEDLHWAGRSALNLLRYVVEHVSEVPLLVLATYRATPPDRSEVLGGVLADLVRRDDVHRIDLMGLGVSDVTRFLVASGAGTPEAVAAAAALLHDHTGGNPFVLNELWRDVTARGGLEALRAGVLGVPESLRAVVAGRLAELTEAHRELVGLAAVAGVVVDASVVAGASDRQVSPEDALAAMEAARAVGLLEQVVDHPGQYHFAHVLAQQAVQAEFGARRVARAHAAIAEALRSRTGSGPAELYRVAHHYAQAAGLGLEAEAAHHLRLAGQSAEDQLALSDAAAFYERATGFEVPGPPRDRLLLAAARCHLLAGRRLRAMQLDERASASTDPEIRLLAAIGYVAAMWRAGSGAGAHRGVTLLQGAIRSSGRSADDPLVVRAAAALASALMLTGAEDEARRCVRDAIERARAIGDRRLLATVLDESLFVGVGLDSLGERAAHAAELSELSRVGPHWTHAGRAAMVRCHAAYVTGDRTALSSALEELGVAARESRQPYISWTLHLFTASLQLLRCDVTAARATMAAGRRIEAGFEPGASAGEGPASLQQFMIRRESGRLGFARTMMESGLQPTDPWRPGVVALCIETGMTGRAREALHDALRWDVTTLRRSAIWPASLSFLGEAAVELGDEDAMRALLPEAERFVGVNLMGGEMLALCGSGDLLVGLLRAGLGLPGAETCFARSLEMDRRTGSVLHEATTQAHWAAHLRRSGAAADRVRVHERPAREVATHHGLARVLRILGPTQPRPVPDGLTGREVEVLGLLAEGASNREIARRLVISEHTAANHVRSILMKTGSRNRTSAARYAVRHGLVHPSSDDGQS